MARWMRRTWCPRDAPPHPQLADLPGDRPGRLGARVGGGQAVVVVVSGGRVMVPHMSAPREALASAADFRPMTDPIWKPWSDAPQDGSVIMARCWAKLDSFTPKVTHRSADAVLIDHGRNGPPGVRVCFTDGQWRQRRLGLRRGKYLAERAWFSLSFTPTEWRRIKP